MKVSEFLKWALFWCIVSFIVGYLSAGKVYAKKPDVKAKFYDFSDQMINGEIKKPATIYIDTRTRAKFEKLLRLKRSFIKALLLTGKEPILK